MFVCPTSLTYPTAITTNLDKLWKKSEKTKNSKPIGVAQMLWPLTAWATPTTDLPM